MTGSDDDLDVRELRYFVAVAEELNFSRAADRLGISQPPLSRAIRRMERRLGTTLFDRDTHRVALTPAGAALLDDARDALAVVAAVTRRARRAAQPSPGLVVTAKPGLPAGLLRAIVAAYRALPEAVPVEIVVSGYGRQADLVRAGHADVALLGSPYESRLLDAEPLVTEPRVAALPADHPLAHRDRLRCADLAGLPVPRWPQWTPAERRYWSGRDDPAADGPTVTDPAQLLEVVGLGQAVALVPRSVADQHPRPDVVYRPVVDAGPYTVAVAWPAGSRSPAIARFVRVATDLHATRAA